MKKFFLAALITVASLAANAQDEQAYEDLIQQQATTSMVPLAAEDLVPEMKPKFPSFLTDKQVQLLSLAQQIAEKDGQEEPKLLQGLLMQETSAGEANYKKEAALNHCYGVLQIKIAAAVHVLTEFPELLTQFNVSLTNKKALIKKLINDDEFNISVGSKYILILRKAGYSTMKQLALAYNQGAGGAKRKNPNTFPYVKGVMKHIASIEE